MIIGCDDCGMTTMDVIMLKEEIWKSIAAKRRILCASCIENRLGRLLVLTDLKPCGATNQLLLGARIGLNSPRMSEDEWFSLLSESRKNELVYVNDYEALRQASITREADINYAKEELL